MKQLSFNNAFFRWALCGILLYGGNTLAQTDADAIMMSSHNLCIGPSYSYSTWNKYWEGTHKRDNQNVGTVTTQMIGVMGTYGITNKLNVLFGLPYVMSNATGGTWHKQQGLQDLSLWLKWMPIEQNLGKGVFSLYGIAGVSVPASNYENDYLPLSIGLHTTNVTWRVSADYQLNNLFATGSASYVWRSNTTIDRDAYYTTEMHLTNKVEMPDAAQFMFRTGYRSERMVAEAIVSNWTTLGGFDITRNNMPFASNRMNMTNVGVNMKYNIKAVDGLSVVAGGSYTVAGRNVGQATTVEGAVFYILDFSPKHKSSSKTSKTIVK